jgi:hypothetical protein
LTIAQATLLASLVTFLGAIVAVLLGWGLFSGKVRDINSALSATSDKIKNHQSNVIQVLADIEARVAGLAESAGQLRADVLDQKAAEPLPEGGKPDIESADAVPAEEDLFFALAAGWHAIRDRLEEIAADPNIDGRTAAKYQRIDRRNYADLIESLSRDNRITDREAFLEAARLWSRFRSRRAAPGPQDVAEMSKWVQTLVPQVPLGSAA